jgi:serine/threonine protein kinase
MKYFTISWEDYVKNNKLDMKQLNRIMICAINILSSIHKNSIIHLDIKPANFMFWKNQLFIIDFGMASSINEDVCEYPTKEHIVGTPKYTSYFIHAGHEARPRDDMISLGYTYMSFLLGLPWSTRTIQDSSIAPTHICHPDNIQRKHAKTWENIQTHCKDYPHLLNYFSHCYNIEKRLDYNVLMNLFL